MQKLKGVTNEAMYIYTQNKLNIIGVNERSMHGGFVMSHLFNNLFELQLRTVANL